MVKMYTSIRYSCHIQNTGVHRDGSDDNNVQRWKTDDEPILHYSICAKTLNKWSKTKLFLQMRQSFICGTVTIVWTQTQSSGHVTLTSPWKQTQVCTGESGSEQRC